MRQGEAAALQNCNAKMCFFCLVAFKDLQGTGMIVHRGDYPMRL